MAVKAMTLGAQIAVRFDYSPMQPGEPSVGFYLDSTKIGDAPRSQRGMLGRMVLGGRKVDAVLSRLREPTEHDDWAAYASIRLHRGVCLPTDTRPVSPAFKQDVAEDLGAQRFVRLVGEAVGFEPVFLQAGRIVGATRSDASLGQPLAVAPDLYRGTTTYAYETLDGARLGQDQSIGGTFVGNMVKAGLVLGAVVIPGPPWNQQLWAATYLLG